MDTFTSRQPPGAILPLANNASGSLRLLRREESGERVPTAFVLSGGGARGASQVGALRALFEHGIRPDMVIGTSIGAWNAAFLARWPTLAGVEALAEIWRGLHPATVMLGCPAAAKHPKRTLRARLLMAALGRVGRGRSSLYDDAGMRTLLAAHIGDTTFEGLALPLRVIAANLTYGGRGVFSSGPVAPAVLASSAIPGIFPPVRIGDAVYADGGTVDGCSVETAVALGARRIFVLANGFDLIGDGGARWAASSPGDSYSMAAVLQRASQVMGTFQIQQALERVPRDIETHIISLSTGDDGGTLNFGAVSAWIERSYEATRCYLQGANNSSTSRLTALPHAISHVA